MEVQVEAAGRGTRLPSAVCGHRDASRFFTPRLAVPFEGVEATAKRGDKPSIPGATHPFPTIYLPPPISSPSSRDVLQFPSANPLCLSWDLSLCVWLAYRFYRFNARSVRQSLLVLKYCQGKSGVDEERVTLSCQSLGLMLLFLSRIAQSFSFV